VTRFLDRLQPLALLVMRLALGAVMIAHGYGKVFGGMQKFTAMVGGMGMPWWLAYAAAYTEFAGGILIILGLITRLVGLAMAVEMAVAIWKLHWKIGLAKPGGYDLPLAVGVIALALIFFGAGPASLDRLLFGRKAAAK